jgi:hypothetical protein
MISQKKDDKSYLNDVKVRSRKAVSSIIDDGNQLLGIDKIPKNDQVKVEELIRDVSDEYDQIELLINNLAESDPGLAWQILLRLTLLFFETYLLGVHSLVTGSARRIMDIERGMAARSAKSAMDKSREQRLIDAIKLGARAATQKAAASEKFARAIRPEVLRRLGVKEVKPESRWPSVSTIKTQLIGLKKKGQNLKL